MTIANDTVVSIHYTLTDDTGAVLDSSQNTEPLQYIHGRNYLLPKLEEFLAGKQAGDRFSADISAADGYGEYDAKLVADVPRSNFDTDQDIEEGMVFQADTPQGVQMVVVTKVSPETITIDANHEFAGKNLHFAIQVVDVRQASAEELASGLGHSCGGCGGSCGGGCEEACGSACESGCAGGCCH